MKVWGLNKAGLELALLLTNVKYGDNLEFYKEPVYKKSHWVFTIRVKDSLKVGARRGSKGQLRIHACWHAYRDLYATIFSICSQARVKTVRCDYKGKKDFEDNFEKTGDEVLNPDFGILRDACNCKGFE